MGDCMGFSKYPLDIKTHRAYNEHGKSFEELLAEAIKQANLESIRKRIITSNATLTKERATNE